MVGWYYSITAVWGPRPETPAQVADQWLRGMDAISQLGPRFARWKVKDTANQQFLSLRAARAQMARIVEGAVLKDDWGKPAPDEGYRVQAFTTQGGDDLEPDDFDFLSKLGSEWKNYVWLNMGFIGRPGDLSAIRYPEMKALISVIAANWKAPWVNAGISCADITPLDVASNDLFFASPNGWERRPYGRPWVSYLSAERTVGLRIPSVLTSERTPDGGLLLSAVTEQFDPENTDQLALSSLLSEIMAERGGNPGL